MRFGVIFKIKRMKNLESFDFGYIYHVYSHANGKDLIFEESNYHYFWKSFLNILLRLLIFMLIVFSLIIFIYF